MIAFDRPGYGHSERPRGVLRTPDRQACLLAAAREFRLELSYRLGQIRALTADGLMLRSATAALARRYRDVAVPVIVLAGESDSLNARDHAMLLHRLISRSVARIVPRTGHMIHHAARAAVAQAVGIAREEADAAS